MGTFLLHDTCAAGQETARVDSLGVSAILRVELMIADSRYIPKIFGLIVHKNKINYYHWLLMQFTVFGPKIHVSELWYIKYVNTTTHSMKVIAIECSVAT
jgi:hypothetical protein